MLGAGGTRTTQPLGWKHASSSARRGNMGNISASCIGWKCLEGCGNQRQGPVEGGGKKGPEREKVIDRVIYTRAEV